MDFRKIFDTIPNEFDKYRPRYCDELFSDLIEHSKVSLNKTALEIGPGTGQATEPILKTGCSYLAIELGENLAEFMNTKFKSYYNFQLVTADFELYNFDCNRFDLVYSAAAFQWIKREIGYPKVYSILKSGGTFATFSVATGSRAPALEDKIQEVYAEYFRPETNYREYMEQKNKKSQNADPIQASGQEEILKIYGFIDIECRRYSKVREFNADDYVA
jgi:ubiquinone/menaquinone biosynthesis C-methylase UbiE